MKHLMSIVFAFLVAIPLAGCSDVPRYAPPAGVAAESLAVVRVKDLEIKRIDGARAADWMQENRIEPGERRLEVQTRPSGTETAISQYHATFEPGHHYLLYLKYDLVKFLERANLRVMLEDQTTGQTIQLQK